MRLGRRHRRSDRGQVAGVEAIPCGIAVFVGLTLVIVKGRAQINSRSIADSVAREYLRAYTHARSQPAARAAGDRAAARVLAAHELGENVVGIDRPTTFGPCAMASVTVRITLPAVRVPFIGTLGNAEVTAVQRDRVEPYRIFDAPVTALEDTDCAA